MCYFASFHLQLITVAAISLLRVLVRLNDRSLTKSIGKKVRGSGGYIIGGIMPQISWRTEKNL